MGAKSTKQTTEKVEELPKNFFSRSCKNIELKGSTLHCLAHHVTAKGRSYYYPRTFDLNRAVANKDGQLVVCCPRVSTVHFDCHYNFDSSGRTKWAGATFPLHVRTSTLFTKFCMQTV